MFPLSFEPICSCVASMALLHESNEERMVEKLRVKSGTRLRNDAYPCIFQKIVKNIIYYFGPFNLHWQRDERRDFLGRYVCLFSNVFVGCRRLWNMTENRTSARYSPPLRSLWKTYNKAGCFCWGFLRTHLFIVADRNMLIHQVGKNQIHHVSITHS